MLITVTLLISLGCHPLEGVTPDLFYLSDLIRPLFFVNSATIFFIRVSLHLGGGAQGAVRPLPRPPSDANAATDHVDDDASQKLSLFWRELGEQVAAWTLEQRERHGEMVILQHRHVVVYQRQL